MSELLGSADLRQRASPLFGVSAVDAASSNRRRKPLRRATNLETWPDDSSETGRLSTECSPPWGWYRPVFDVEQIGRMDSKVRPQCPS